MAKGTVLANILSYMNARSDKEYSYLEVSTIVSAIIKERAERKASGLVIKGKTQKGRQEINRRVAGIVNSDLNRDVITEKCVRLYKQCFADEYMDRTGRCAWGFPEVRRKLGFDAESGLEIKEGCELNA